MRDIRRRIEGVSAEAQFDRPQRITARLRQTEPVRQLSYDRWVIGLYGRIVGATCKHNARDGDTRGTLLLLGTIAPAAAVALDRGSAVAAREAEESTEVIIPRVRGAGIGDLVSTPWGIVLRRCVRAARFV